MDAYARNFNRDGINSHKDLVWFAKLENYRYYSHKDPEVKQRLKQRGDRKEGEQMHVQVIVSRKDATNKVKLSPMNTSRGKNMEHSKKMGQFDRVAFKQSGETLFDSLFSFDRQLKETLVYANVQKNGKLAQREQMGLLKGRQYRPGKRNRAKEEKEKKIEKPANHALNYREILIVQMITKAIGINNYEQVKLDVQEVISSEIRRLLRGPPLHKCYSIDW